MPTAILTLDSIAGDALARLTLAFSALEAAGPYSAAIRLSITRESIDNAKGTKGRERCQWLEFQEDACLALIPSRPKLLIGLATERVMKAAEGGGYTVIVFNPRSADSKLAERWATQSGYNPDDVRWISEELAKCTRMVARPTREWQDVLDVLSVARVETGEVSRMGALEKEVLAPLIAEFQKQDLPESRPKAEFPLDVIPQGMSPLESAEPDSGDQEAS